jgi:hypothetical protein
MEDFVCPKVGVESVDKEWGAAQIRFEAGTEKVLYAVVIFRTTARGGLFSSVLE